MATVTWTAASLTSENGDVSYISASSDFSEGGNIYILVQDIMEVNSCGVGEEYKMFGQQLAGNNVLGSRASIGDNGELFAIDGNSLSN